MYHNALYINASVTVVDGKIKVTTLSQPAELVSKGCSVVRCSVSISIYPSICITMSCTSTPVLLLLMVRSRVTTLSQPAELVSVKVAVLLDAV